MLYVFCIRLRNLHLHHSCSVWKCITSDYKRELETWNAFSQRLKQLCVSVIKLRSIVGVIRIRFVDDFCFKSLCLFGNGCMISNSCLVGYVSSNGYYSQYVIDHCNIQNLPSYDDVFPHYKKFRLPMLLSSSGYMFLCIL